MWVFLFASFFFLDSDFNYCSGLCWVFCYGSCHLQGEMYWGRTNSGYRQKGCNTYGRKYFFLPVTKEVIQYNGENVVFGIQQILAQTLALHHQIVGTGLQQDCCKRYNIHSAQKTCNKQQILLLLLYYTERRFQIKTARLVKSVLAVGFQAIQKQCY